MGVNVPGRRTGKGGNEPAGNEDVTLKKRRGAPLARMEMREVAGPPGINFPIFNFFRPPAAPGSGQLEEEIRDGRGEQQAVAEIEHAADAGDRGAGVFHVGAALHDGFDEVGDDAEDGDRCGHQRGG